MTESPPHSPDLERTFLGGLLAKPKLVDVARDIVQNAMYFYGRNHQLVYATICRLADKGEVPGMVRVAEAMRCQQFQAALDELSHIRKLNDADQLKLLGREQRKLFYRDEDTYKAEAHQDSVLAAIGGYATLAELSSDAMANEHIVREQGRMLAQYYLRRQMLKKLRTCDQLVRSDEDADASLTSITSMFESIAPVDDKSETIATIAEFTDAHIDDEAAVVDTGSWGWGALDKVVETDRGLLNILSGESGTGKTSLAIQCMRHTARAQDFAPGAVAFASVEVKKSRLVEVAWAQAAQCFVGDVHARTWTGEQRETARRSSETWGESITINDGELSRWSLIAAWARQHARKYGPAFHTLIIDHLHLLQPETRNGDAISTVDMAIQGAVQLKKELNIHILFLAQPNKLATRSDGAPKQSDIKGSSSAQQGADAIVILTRDQNTGCNTAHVVKNRWGECNSLSASFDPSRGQVWGSVSHHATSGDPYGIASAYTNAKMALPPSKKEDLFA